GMTHGAIAGLLLTDLILGRDNPWSEIYDPSRKSVRAIAEFAREGAASQVGYAGWVTGGDVASEREIALGEGAIVRRGLSKVAVYREADGRFIERSAVCPHLGCIVEWNRTEKTWDCPCHGSRFATDGHVVNGPAVGDLAPAK
ncbi:MAG: Rieske 2Fe-2S domain-containing protein, partial [Myxococcota bacterium]